MKENLVDFIGIGFSKCGTTWVFRCLEEHPEICVSRQKETMYFSRKYEKGEAWYRDQFSHCISEKIRGEFTPDYAYYPESAPRIKESVPNAKLIVVIRDQVSRMKSMWRYQYIRGKHKFKNFEDYLTSNNDKVWERGLYHTHLQPYYSHFDTEKILLIDYDEICTNPVSTIKRLFQFLEVDCNFTPSRLHKKINAGTSTGVRSVTYGRLLSKGRHLMRHTRVGKFLIPIFEKTGLKKIVQKFERVNLSTKPKNYNLNPSLSEDMHKRIKEYYKNEIKT